MTRLPSAGPPPEEADEDPDDAPDAFEVSSAPTPVDVAAEFAPALTPEQANGCVRCGNSCRSVYLWQGPLDQFKERDTKRWVEYHELETFTAKAPDGKLYWGVKIPKPCRFLYEESPGTFGCAVYSTRPYVCRIYTGVNPDGPQPGCGFNRAPPGAP